MRLPSRQSGFSLVELLVVMGIFAFVMAAASEMFVSMLSSSKQQGKIAVSNIEGIIGLEMMRRDVENAGYGLFTSLTQTITYSEVENSGEAVGKLLNDSPQGIPRPFAIADDVATNHGSDRLAIKAVNVAMNDTAERWTYVDSANAPHQWTPATAKANPVATDRVIVISPDISSKTLALVTTSTGGFSATFNSLSSFASKRASQSLVYAVDPLTDLKMPFNRADYYIDYAGTIPGRCAQGTGILYKRVVSHASDGYLSPMPVLDCAADMQVAVMVDVDGDPNTADNAVYEGKQMTAWTAADIRSKVRELQVFILVQEGQYDRSYTHGDKIMRVGAPVEGTLTAGRDFDLSAYITDWQRYRWKLYTLVAKPVNLY